MASTKQATKKGSKTPKSPFSDEELRHYFRQMLLCRRFEEKTGQQYQMKKFSGFCHLYIGQEAVVAGTLAAVEVRKDYIFQTYRDHAHALLLGLSARDVMAELFMLVILTAANIW